MIIELRVSPAKKCPKRDVIAALDIYCKAVDSGSMTDTNQINEYIWNEKKHHTESRKMFFYLLYDSDNQVEGFAEFAYLPKNRALVLDYLCTQQRNHFLFYNFYHMVLSEVRETLKKSGQFVQYIVTELSLQSFGGQLIDVDSNYFRHLLSNENFKLLKYPYYQPPLLPSDTIREFNLAIMRIDGPSSVPLTYTQTQYLSLVHELYYEHYLPWYEHVKGFHALLDDLMRRINQEIVDDKHCIPVSFVQCQLFDEGQCPKISVENITLKRVRRRRWSTILSHALCIALAVLTLIFCVLPTFEGAVAVVTAFLTIISGLLSVFSLPDVFFRTK